MSDVRGGIKPVELLQPGEVRRNTKNLKGGEADEFKRLLNQRAAPRPEVSAPSRLSFSSHAVERMQRRGIHFDANTMGRIEDAVGRAAAKGAKETLVLTEDAALIVNHANQKIVTVMGRDNLKENVFTQIDSTVFV